MSEGIRSGVNWTRPRVEAEHGAERLDELGLGEAGHADEQAVAAGEEGDERRSTTVSWPKITVWIASRARPIVSSVASGAADDGVVEARSAPERCSPSSRFSSCQPERRPARQCAARLGPADASGR